MSELTLYDSSWVCSSNSPIISFILLPLLVPESFVSYEFLWRGDVQARGAEGGKHQKEHTASKPQRLHEEELKANGG